MKELENAKQLFSDMDLEDESMQASNKEETYEKVPLVDSFFISILGGSLVGLAVILLTVVL